MTKNTANAIATARAIYDDYVFTRDEWERDQPGCTLETAIRVGAVRKVRSIHRDYYTVQELVEMLNNCSGNDCYDSEWRLQVDEQGRAYEDRVEIGYQMVEE